MDIKKGWQFLQDYFKNTNQNECYLYFNIKKNKFETFSERNSKRKEYQIILGIWSRKADYCKFEDELEVIRYTFSLYDVNELTKLAKKSLINDVGPNGYDYLIPDLWFKSASWVHDLMYYIGGSNQDKNWADKVFLWKMKANTTGFRKLGFFFPKIYYWAVKYFGKKSFCYRKEKLNIMQINRIFHD